MREIFTFSNENTMAWDDQGRKKSYLRLKEDIPVIVNRS